MIKVGTCGFSFKDWKGTVYPRTLKAGDYLSYYADTLKFDTVEIDASYYSLLSADLVKRWLAVTPPGFLFSVKCHKDMTLNEKTCVQGAFPGERIRQFLDSFSPLIESKRLLSFLAQFGPLFSRTEAHKEYIARLSEAMKGCPLALEFRHRSWFAPEVQQDTFSLLEKHHLSHVMADLPALRELPPLVPHSCGSLAYMRLHGRNPRWFGAGRENRYDYLYSEGEIAEFIPHIIQFEGKTDVTVVYFNNCHAGSSMKNALKLKKLLQLDAGEGSFFVQGEFDFGSII